MGAIKKNIFITGGQGFIGRNLKEYFESRYNVFAPSHDALDLLDEYAVDRYVVDHKIHIIIHCASVGGGRDMLDLRDVVSQNLRMFFNIIRAAKHVERIIDFGSGAEYDIRFYKSQMAEEYFGEHVPVDDYGFSKYASSRYILASQEPIVRLRLFGVFGKYEKYQIKFISNAIVKNLLSLPIVVNQNVYFDYLFIDDLMKIVEYFISHTVRERVYNITTGNVIDLVSIAEFVNSIGKQKSMITILKDGLGKEYSGLNTRLMGELKGIAFTSIRDAIHELYRWYENKIETIDKDLIKKGDQYIPWSRVSKK